MNLIKIVFVGECRSLTAKRKKWSWKDGHLAAKPLFEALRAMGVDPAAHDYTNLWTDGDPPFINWQTKKRLQNAELMGWNIVVALGQRVSKKLTELNIEHVALVHPAARGKIRKKSRYRAHVRNTLAPHIARSPS